MDVTFSKQDGWTMVHTVLATLAENELIDRAQTAGLLCEFHDGDYQRIDKVGARVAELFSRWWADIESGKNPPDMAADVPDDGNYYLAADEEAPLCANA